MRTHDYSRNGRNKFRNVKILDERGEKSAPKSLQMTLRNPLRTFRKTLWPELWDRAGSAHFFQILQLNIDFLSSAGSTAAVNSAPNPWTPKPKREPSSESFREQNPTARKKQGQARNPKAITRPSKWNRTSEPNQIKTQGMASIWTTFSETESNQCNGINPNQHQVKSHQKLELNQLKTHQSPMEANYQTEPNELGPIRIKLNQLEPPQIELNTTLSQGIESTIINPTKVERNTIK